MSLLVLLTIILAVIPAGTALADTAQQATGRISIDPPPRAASGRGRESDYVPRTFDITGWALDPTAGAGSGPGVDVVQVFLGRGCNGVLLGEGTTGIQRADLAEELQQLGLDESYASAGYTVTLTDVPIGRLSFTVCARSDRTGEFVAGRAQAVFVSGRVEANGDYVVVQSTQYLGLLATLVSVVLFFMCIRGLFDHVSGGAATILLILVVVWGLAIRLFIAVNTYGNFDMDSYTIVTNILQRGGSVYAETVRYNYTPVWFWILGALRGIAGEAGFPFAVRGFLTVIDLLTLPVLILIARHEKLSPAKAAILFFLNPVSFLITGFHGQFENISILLLTLGVLAQYRLQAGQAKAGAWWALSTLATIVKHNVFYEILIGLQVTVKTWWVRWLLLGASGLLFMATFLPYWSGAQQQIQDNVLTYTGLTGYYGISNLIPIEALRYVIVASLVLYPLVIGSSDLVKRALLGVLFFLCVTTGIGSQYFVLPLAFGALRPSKGFYIFTAMATLYILGGRFNVNQTEADLFHFNFVWVGAVIWWLTTQFEVNVRLSPDDVPAWARRWVRE